MSRSDSVADFPRLTNHPIMSLVDLKARSHGSSSSTTIQNTLPPPTESVHVAYGHTHREGETKLAEEQAANRSPRLSALHRTRASGSCEGQKCSHSNLKVRSTGSPAKLYANPHPDSFPDQFETRISYNNVGGLDTPRHDLQHHGISIKQSKNTHHWQSHNALEAVDLRTNAQNPNEPTNDSSTFSLSRFPIPPAPHFFASRITRTKEIRQGDDLDVAEIRQLNLTAIESSSNSRTLPINSPEWLNTVNLNTMESPESAQPPTNTPPDSRRINNGPGVGTSTRPIFDDFASAYTSILARVAKYTPEAALQNQDLPLPPVPIPTRDSPAHSNATLTAQVPATPLPHILGRRLPPFCRQSPDVFAAKFVASTSSRSLSSSHEVESEIKRQEKLYNDDFRSSNSGLGSEVVSSDGPINEVETGRGNQGSSLRPLSDDSDPYYGDESLYPALSSRENTAPLRDAMLHQKANNFSVDDVTTDRDHCAGTIIDAYNYTHSQPNLRSVVAQRKAEFEATTATMSSQPDHSPQLADSTIVQILNHYHHGTHTSPIRYNFGQRDEIGSTIQVLRPSSPIPEPPSPVLAESSGLSRLDFGFPPVGGPEGSGSAVHSTMSLTDPFQDPFLHQSSASNRQYLPELPHFVDRRHSFDVLHRYSSESDRQADWSAYGSSPDMLHVSPQRFLHPSGRPTFSGLSAYSDIVPSAALPGLRGMRLPNVRPFSEGFTTSERLPHSDSFSSVVRQDLSHIETFGVHGMNGAVFVLSKTSSLDELSSNDEKKALAFQSSSSIHLEEPDPQLPAPLEVECAPIATCKQSDVLPAVLRQQSEGRFVLEHSTISEIHLSDSPPSSEANASEVEGDADDQDWETVAESRPTLHTQKIGSSWANLSSNDSLAAFRNVSMHPGDPRFQHSYRMHSSATSDVSVLMPSYDFRGEPAFPERNALTMPLPVVHPAYRLPPSSQCSYDNPFINSRPFLGDRTIVPTRFEEFLMAAPEPTPPVTRGLARQMFAVREPNLSVVFEHSDEIKTPQQLQTRFDSIAPTALQVITSESSAWLDTEPGPSIDGGSDLEDDVDSHAATPDEKGKMHPRSVVLSSGVNLGLLHEARYGGKYITPSPMSIRNSFSKMTKLGPHANLTGTPEGTGMRLVGSSIVGSSIVGSSIVGSSIVGSSIVGSSPLTRLSSSVRGPQTYAIPRSSQQVGTLSSSAQNVHSPLQPWEISRFSASTAESDSPRRGSKFREEMLAANRLEFRARASLGGQKGLLGLALPSCAELEEGHRDSARPCAREAIESRFSDRLHHLLLPYSLADVNSPRIIGRTRSSSSTASLTRSRKKRISWLTFIGLCIFPPLLVIYGHGYMDAYLAYATHGQITHFGHRQKAVAKRLGYFLTISIVLSITVALVVINEIPNDLPR